MTINNTTGRHTVLAIDGACLGNPGPGGWAVVIHEMDGDTVVSRSALAGRADGDTTNNRMEMTAAIEALRYLGSKRPVTTIVSDSQILVNGMTQWIEGWKANGWRKSDRKQLLNLDLWMALDEMCPKSRAIRWEWTLGHYENVARGPLPMPVEGAVLGDVGIRHCFDHVYHPCVPQAGQKTQQTQIVLENQRKTGAAGQD
jgi:ribonuclease HI